MSKLLTKDFGNAAGRFIDGVTTLLFKLPEDLETSLFSLAVKSVDDHLQRLGNLDSLVHGHLDDGSHVDIDGSSIGKPLSELGVRLLKGLAATNNGAARDDVGWNHERKVQLWKRTDQDLEALRTILEKIEGSSKDGVGSQVRLHLLSLRVILNGLCSVEGEMKVERHLAPWHRILKLREEARRFR